MTTRYTADTTARIVRYDSDDDAASQAAQTWRAAEGTKHDTATLADAG